MQLESEKWLTENGLYGFGAHLLPISPRTKPSGIGIDNFFLADSSTNNTYSLEKLLSDLHAPWKHQGLWDDISAALATANSRLQVNDLPQ